MEKILKIGTVLKVDRDGFLVSQSNLNKIKPPWTLPIEDLKDACLSHFGKNLHSFYVRGSVSRGTPIEGVSDIDCLAVVYGPIEDLDLTWVKKFTKSLKVKYPFSTGFDLVTVSYEDIISGEKKVTRFFIKTLSACTYGEDLATKLPKVRPGRDSAVSIWRIREYVYEKIDLLQNCDKKINLKNQCKWIMKRLLRVSFELVMGQAQVFTRDLYPSYEIFSKYYPSKEPEARRILELAVRQDEEREGMLAILNGFGKWLVKEVENQGFGGRD